MCQAGMPMAPLKLHPSGCWPLICQGQHPLDALETGMIILYMQKRPLVRVILAFEETAALAASTLVMKAFLRCGDHPALHATEEFWRFQVEKAKRGTAMLACNSLKDFVVACVREMRGRSFRLYWLTGSHSLARQLAQREVKLLCSRLLLRRSRGADSSTFRNSVSSCPYMEQSSSRARPNG